MSLRSGSVGPRRCQIRLRVARHAHHKAHHAKWCFLSVTRALTLGSVKKYLTGGELHDDEAACRGRLAQLVGRARLQNKQLIRGHNVDCYIGNSSIV